jgi:hypothetical protein
MLTARSILPENPVERVHGRKRGRPDQTDRLKVVVRDRAHDGAPVEGGRLLAAAVLLVDARCLHRAEAIRER